MSANRGLCVWLEGCSGPIKGAQSFQLEKFHFALNPRTAQQELAAVDTLPASDLKSHIGHHGKVRRS